MKNEINLALSILCLCLGASFLSCKKSVDEYNVAFMGYWEAENDSIGLLYLDIEEDGSGKYYENSLSLDFTIWSSGRVKVGNDKLHIGLLKTFDINHHPVPEDTVGTWLMVLDTDTFRANK